MSEENKSSPSTTQTFDLDLLGVLKRMQQQLGFLEKKIDTLIKQSSDKPFRERNFSQPFRQGGFGQHRGGQENRGEFGQRKKQFFPRRKDRS